MTDNQQPSTRTCRACGAVKPLAEFAKVYAQNSRGQQYRSHSCLVCHRKVHAAKMRAARKAKPSKYRRHQREHRKRHLERVRRQRRESGLRRKMRVMAHYGNGKCQCCGEACMTMLTIDHVNNNGREHRNELNGGLGRFKSVEIYTWLEANGYPEGFQVLCYNCNISKHRNGGICEHRSGEGSTTSRKAYPQARGNAGRPRKGSVI
jgi:hypothetical protein